VEPTLAGTSVRAVTEALRDRPTRILCLGVGRQELRGYGAPWGHARAHGLDAAGNRASIDAFLESRRGPAGLWEHPARPELSRRLTLELLLSRRRLAAGDWAGTAPSLPFHGTSRRRGGW